MNYSNPISLRLLSICDARYKSGLLAIQQNVCTVINQYNNQISAQPEKTNPPGLRVAGSGLLSLFRRQIFW